MSDATFLAKMAPYAMSIAAATGLDCRLFLVQWALESNWGTSTVASHNNYAGIENSSGKGCSPCDGIYTCCPTVADFAALYTAIISDSTYASVRAAAGESLTNQLEALGRSPWAASNYETGCGYPGCELVNLYASQRELFDEYCAPAVANPCVPNPCPAGCTCAPAGPDGAVPQCICPSSTPPAGYPSSSSVLPVLAIAAGGALGVLAWRQTGRSIPLPAGVHSALQPRPSRR